MLRNPANSGTVTPEGDQPMNTIDIQDLVQDVIAVLDRVAAGEQFVMTRDGHPIAELRPVAPRRVTPRPYGLAAGAFVVPDDFDSPLPERFFPK
jgi:antitoxin (DNA-binding transcriptional repressor) of toxin-antitoxin stability system